MRKIISFAIAGFLLSPAAFAATTDTIELSGSVSSTAAIDCTDTTAATALDLESAGADAVVHVSACTASTNDDGGLTITFSSGDLTKTGTTDVFPFQVTSVAAGGTAPASTDFSTASGQDYTTASSASGAHDQDAYIMFSSDSAADPGTYTGSISVTVADNT